MCRPKSGSKGRKGAWASSVMLLDCAKLRHWQFEKNFTEMFKPVKRDYMDWVSLKLEDPATIAPFENQWNDFDHLDADTKLLHNTKRKTQPWKTGLPVDYTPADKFKDKPLLASANRVRAKVFGEYGLLGRYREHPDPAQQDFFFGLLKECLKLGHVNEALVREEIRKNHVRHDAFEVLDRTPDLQARAA